MLFDVVENYAILILNLAFAYGCFEQAAQEFVTRYFNIG